MDLNFFLTYECPFEKKHIGNKGDGGYVIALIDNHKYDCLLSCGVGDDTSFEQEFLTMYNPISFSFDGTVKSLPSNFPVQMNYISKNIGSQNSLTETNLHDFCSRFKNIFIKMDIEGYEFPFFDALPEEYFNNIDQIVCEFHFVLENFEEKNKVYQKLKKYFNVVHAHGNNAVNSYTLIIDDKKFQFPRLLELTLLNKKYFKKTKLNQSSLNEFNYPNKSECPVYDLNFPPFQFE